VKALAVAALALAVALGLELRYGSPVEPDLSLRLGNLGPAPKPATAPMRRGARAVIRFAIAPVLSPAATARSYTALAAYLSAFLDRPVQLVHGKSYAEINSLIRQQEVALALVCSGAYVHGKREFGMEALVVPVIAGKKTYRSYMIVPASSPVRSWQGLRNRSFAFTDPLSNTGRMAPTYLLADSGLSPGTFFRSVTFTYSHDRSIEAIASGLVDGAAVDSLVYDGQARTDPDLLAKTRVVWRSPPYGIQPIVVAPGIDPDLRSRIAGVLTSMHRRPHGRRVLALLEIDRFEPPTPGAYDSLERMMRRIGIR
jgi:phosphonate transport system substrate-binding protein